MLPRSPRQHPSPVPFYSPRKSCDHARDSACCPPHNGTSAASVAVQRGRCCMRCGISLQHAGKLSRALKEPISCPSFWRYLRIPPCGSSCGTAGLSAAVGGGTLPAACPRGDACTVRRVTERQDSFENQGFSGEIAVKISSRGLRPRTPGPSPGRAH